ncbi:MAG: hypothetical protein MJ252_14010 [archaeon]|nr:hypothetical protein [archaeon]
MQSKCLHEGSCGWCQGTKKCIMGTQYGPSEYCPQGTYIFSYNIQKSDEDLKEKEELVIVGNGEAIKISNN